MRKKIGYMLCLVLCMGMMTACGQKKAGTEGEKEQSKKSEAKFTDRENLDMGSFKVYYPENWKYDKENMQNEENFSVVSFFDGEAINNSEHNVYIEATREETYSFRKNLVALGVELENYAEGKMETISIGNTEYTVMPGNNSGSTTYKYRYEGAETAYTIRVHGGVENDSVEKLLEGIILEPKDEGLTDAPWLWDGAPIQPELSQQMVGSYTIVPEYIPFEKPQGFCKLWIISLQCMVIRCFIY